ncbi:MAG: ABC transporter ATP-binding protein/permease, partial [Gammaproteobacteria bacterium]|nr:ABC transporter ATP-binding protein/permease [Gammaproteobacteria bacterium]
MRHVIIGSVMVTVFAASIEVWLIQYAGKIVDILVATNPAELWETEGTGLLFAALVVLFIRPVAQFLRLAVNDISFNCNAATLVRWRAYDHLIRQSVGWFQEDLTGRTSGRLVDIGNHVSDAIHTTLNTVAFGVVYMIGVVTLMAGTEIWLAMPLILWLALYIGVLAWVMPRMIPAQHNFQAAKSALVGSVVDSFSNFETLKLFAPKNQIAREQRGALDDTREALFKTRQIGIALRSTLVLLEAVLMVGFVGYGIWLWSVEAATIGVISAAIALSLRITTMADWILDSIWWLFQRIGSLREALQTIGQPIEIPQRDNAPALTVNQGHIEITGLHHHYGHRHGGLDNVSLSIQPGEKVGIVGRSGAGKSTLVNLLLRFFEAEQGSIVIDGQNIRDVDQDSLRSAVGMVAQQASLLNRSVRENILLGREDVSEDQLIQAATQARAHPFILDLRDKQGRTGYDAHVGERGIKLSGGQRQRIAIARVILKDAPILILDEATSALDSEVESEIQQSLVEIMHNKTVIAIAHRLSTIAR